VPGTGNLARMLYWLRVPDTLVERGEELYEQGKDTVTDFVETAKANPTLLKILIVIGVFTAVLFFWGVAKQAMKAMVIGGLLSFAAWYWYFNIH